jgi:hypothetical protein
MRSDYSWDNSAKEYIALYTDLTRPHEKSASVESAPVKKRKTVKKTEKGTETVKEGKAPDIKQDGPGPEQK